MIWEYLRNLSKTAYISLIEHGAVPAQLIKKCIHQQNEKTRPKMRGENIPFRGPKGAEICMREAV